MDKIESKWECLLQCKPDIRGMIGNAKLIGGHMNHNNNHEKIFNFITKKGTFTYSETTDEFKSKLQIGQDMVEELKGEAERQGLLPETVILKFRPSIQDFRLKYLLYSFPFFGSHIFCSIMSIFTPLWKS